MNAKEAEAKAGVLVRTWGEGRMFVLRQESFDNLEGLVAAALLAAVAQDREECAKVVEDILDRPENYSPMNREVVAAAIRARGE